MPLVLHKIKLEFILFPPHIVFYEVQYTQNESSNQHVHIYKVLNNTIYYGAIMPHSKCQGRVHIGGYIIRVIHK